MNSPRRSFTPLPLEAVLQLVNRFRKGDSSAGDELIQRFEPYLHKWRRLLLSGRWDRQDGELRAFLHTLGSVDVSTTAHIVSRRLRIYERDDIEQELKVSLLETVFRYGTVTGHFRHVLRKRLGDLIKDPVIFRGPLTPEMAAMLPTGAGYPDINEAWVEGITCGPGFDELSVRERKVLQYVHWFGFTEDRTAEALGCSRSTVSRALRKAREMLSVHYQRGKE